MKRVVNVLGTPYSVESRETKDDEILESCSGYIDTTTKEIVLKVVAPVVGEVKNLKAYNNRILRHEIIHAFMFESGLDGESTFAVDEVLIDWIAIQFPKLLEAMKKSGALSL